ncbi:MAG: nucleotide exchange factor GrpE [Thermotogota bacterium]
MDKKNKNKLNKKEKKLKEKEEKKRKEDKEKKESKEEKDSEKEEVLYQNLPKEELIELMEKIEEENAEIKKEMEKYKEAAINLKDKFDHYQQIVEKEKKELKKSTKEKIIKNFLKPFEKMTLSMNYKDDPQFVKAIEMVHKDFKNSFEKSDLEFIIPDKGTAFDPFEHDVADKIETDEIKEYHIHSIQNPGYKLEGKIIEPARVIVAVKPKKKVEKEEKNNEEIKKEGDE